MSTEINEDGMDSNISPYYYASKSLFDYVKQRWKKKLKKEKRKLMHGNSSVIYSNWIQDCWGNDGKRERASSTCNNIS